MEQIEIIGYTVIDGKAHTTYPLEGRFINSMDEADGFKEEMKRNYREKDNEEIIVHPVYRHKE